MVASVYGGRLMNYPDQIIDWAVLVFVFVLLSGVVLAAAYVGYSLFFGHGKNGEVDQ